MLLGLNDTVGTNLLDVSINRCCQLSVGFTRYINGFFGSGFVFACLMGLRVLVWLIFKSLHFINYNAKGQSINKLLQKVFK